MKSYKYLYGVCLSIPNRMEGIKAAKRSERIRKIIKERNLSDDAILDLSYEWIVNFQNANHTPIKIRDGITHKQRVIIVPTLKELVVQHCVVNALKPMFTKGMYEHSYASLPKRGAHKAKKMVKKWMEHDTRNTKYVLKMDIRHFFDSVPHSILKEKFAKYVKDEMMLDLIFKIIDVTEHGLPLGFYTSQWFSNWYLQELDHYIKEKLHAAHYVRYMDDMVIFGSNKKTLHRIRFEINEYLKNELGLELKSNWQVFLFDWKGRGRDLDFMGFRFYRNRIVLRKSIMYKATRKASKISKKPKVTIYDVRQMMSYLGWIDCTDTYRMYELWIKPYVNFQRMKRYISKCDKENPKQIYLKLVKLYI